MAKFKNADGTINYDQAKKSIHSSMKEGREGFKSVYDFVTEGHKMPHHAYETWQREENAWLEENEKKDKAGRDQAQKEKEKANAKNVHFAPQTAKPKTAAASGGTIKVNEVDFTPQQFAIISAQLDKYMRAAAQAYQQSNGQRPPLERRKQLGVPHYEIPQVEEMDEEDAEEMAEAALEMNGPENETPEAYANRFMRYQEADVRAHKRKQAKGSFIKDKSVHSRA